MYIHNLFGLIYSNCFCSSTRQNLILQFLHFLEASKQYFLVELGR